MAPTQILIKDPCPVGLPAICKGISNSGALVYACIYIHIHISIDILIYIYVYIYTHTPIAAHRGSGFENLFSVEGTGDLPPGPDLAHSGSKLMVPAAPPEIRGLAFRISR